MTAAFAIGFGLVLLFAGGELLVRGAVDLAQRLGVSKVLIGATVVGFGTSAPELAVALDAVRTGHGDITLGTVVGSNVCNALLILPIASLIHPVRWSPRAMRGDATTLALASVLFAALAATGRLGRLDGALLLSGLVGITVLAIVRARREPPVTVDLLADEAEELSPAPPSLRWSLASAVAGLAGVAFGADVLVHGAVAAARGFGVSEATIGLTLVAFGTSLPELAASASAARRQHSEVALGNVVGSNVFNQLGIAGTAALFAPLAVPPQVVRFELWAMLGVMLAVAGFVVARSRLGRPVSALCLAAYAAWIITRG